MPKRNSKGHFMKTRRRSRRTRTRTRTIVRTRTRHVGRRRSYRRRHGRGGGVRLMPLALATAGLAYLTNDSGPAFIRENVNKIPGAKTFGPTTTAGIACLAIDRFVKPNRWLKLFGLAGIVLGAAQVGKQGASFKWLGDGESSGDFDLGDDDVGDDDEGDIGDDGD